jgi:ketosteroid isomerase-like protein
MSAHVDLVRRTFDALQRHAYREAERGFHHDAVWQNTAAFPGPRRCVGREAIFDFWTSLMDDFDESAPQEIERAVEGENAVAIAVHSVGRGRASRVPVDVRWAAVCEMHDGRIKRVEVHGDWSKALTAMGLE